MARFWEHLVFSKNLSLLSKKKIFLLSIKILIGSFLGEYSAVLTIYTFFHLPPRSYGMTELCHHGAHQAGTFLPRKILVSLLSPSSSRAHMRLSHVIVLRTLKDSGLRSMIHCVGKKLSRCKWHFLVHFCYFWSSIRNNSTAHSTFCSTLPPPIFPADLLQNSH